jgi:hypothetical protein
MKREIIYTDAPPEVDAALERAIKNNSFISLPEFLKRLEYEKQDVIQSIPKPRKRFSFPISKKVAAF